MLVTLVPFSTVLVGHFPRFPIAIWVYLGHNVLMACLFHRLIPPQVDARTNPHWATRRIALRVLIATAV
jgi:uncharacterized membrane protein